MHFFIWIIFGIDFKWCSGWSLCLLEAAGRSDWSWLVSPLHWRLGRNLWLFPGSLSTTTTELRPKNWVPKCAAFIHLSNESNCTGLQRKLWKIFENNGRYLNHNSKLAALNPYHDFQALISIIINTRHQTNFISKYVQFIGLSIEISCTVP